jgi:hypothetical protein
VYFEELKSMIAFGHFYPDQKKKDALTVPDRRP